LKAEGECQFKQTEFGIRPVAAALGTVRVQDQITVTFQVVARQARQANNSGTFTLFNPLIEQRLILAHWRPIKGITRSMNPIVRNTAFRSLFVRPRSCRLGLLWVWVGAAILLGLDVARASFHVWAVTELYSSADGSVQFIKLTNNSSLFTTEYFLAGHVIICTGPPGITNTFTFPTNLPAVSTANKTFLIGTSNLVTVPGGLTPDYVFTNTGPFLFLNTGVANTVGIIGSVETPAVYTNLPADGVSSLMGFGSSLIVATNSPKNFSGQANSIVPVRFTSSRLVDTNLVMTFRTATGVNGTAGPIYTIEYKNFLTDLSWTQVTSVPGDGTTHSVSNATASAAQRFFRLKVP
jgi:hypothetical protein